MFPIFKLARESVRTIKSSHIIVFLLFISSNATSLPSSGEDTSLTTKIAETAKTTVHTRMGSQESWTSKKDSTGIKNKTRDSKKIYLRNTTEIQCTGIRGRCDAGFLWLDTSTKREGIPINNINSRNQPSRFRQAFSKPDQLLQPTSE